MQYIEDKTSPNSNENATPVVIRQSVTDIIPQSCILQSPNYIHDRNDSFRTISSSSSSCSSRSSLCSYSSSSSSCSEYSTSATLTNSELDSTILNKFGYNIIKSITDTIHTTIYQAEVGKISNHIKTYNNMQLFPQKSAIARGLIPNKVTIKKVSKESTNTEKNISKEAQLLYYLTVQNKQPADNICSFIEFIETKNDYYLMQQYGGSMTLSEFTATAHEHIKQKRFTIKKWRIIVKYLFWQLVVNIFWLHNDMNCAHLNLNMENIIVNNVNFRKQKDGSIVIDTNGLSVKIYDFLSSEVFPFNRSSFKCMKYGLTKEDKYKSPNELNEQIFDANKSDQWSLGLLLFKMFTNHFAYQYPNTADNGYIALKNNHFPQYLQQTNLSKYIPKAALNVIAGLLNWDERKRMNIYQVLTDDWYKHYYLKYKSRIEQKSKTQKQKHRQQKNQIQCLPFYILNESSL